ncbi:MAG: hypothetical protein WCY98_09610 [Castellaniella sp.]
MRKVSVSLSMGHPPRGQDSGLVGKGHDPSGLISSRTAGALAIALALASRAASRLMGAGTASAFLPLDFLALAMG